MRLMAARRGGPSLARMLLEAMTAHSGCRTPSSTGLVDCGVDIGRPAGDSGGATGGPSQQGAAAIVECRGLTKRFGVVTAVDALDLTIAAGSVVGFLGPNGAGKTTVLRMLVGLLAPTSRSAEIFGLAPRVARARRRLGYMPADPAFYPRLSGRQNLELLARLQGASAPDRDWALELLDLPQHVLERPVREYSSGMTQKLALVQAVQHRPSLVILDEPANRLDPLAHRRFEQLVRTIAADGRSVFLSSHTLSEVQDVCDRVAMVRAGRLLAVESVTELSARAPSRLRARFRTPPRSLPAGLIDPRMQDGQLQAGVAERKLDVLRELLADEGLEDLNVEAQSLEETFLGLYGDGAQP